MKKTMNMLSKNYWVSLIAAILFSVSPGHASWQQEMRETTESINDNDSRSDNAERVRLLREAAERGDVQSQHDLGLSYYKGDGIPQNQSEAIKWLYTAAEQGYKPAQCMLGTVYAEDAARNYVQAYMWLNLCAAGIGGERQGKDIKLREEIAGQMKPEQIQEAERLTKEWLYMHRPNDPVVIYNPLPSYTYEARKARISGIVYVQCIVRKDGTVDSCKIIRGLGYGLDESVIKTVTGMWQFMPGTLKGKPVDVIVDIEVKFSL